jgi:hypothetical protein
MRHAHPTHIYRQLIYTALTMLGLLQLCAVPVSAQSGAISQSYQTSSSAVAQGTLLSLTSRGSSVVVPAGSDNASNLVGIAASKPLLELSGNAGSQANVQVVVGGSTEVLVSNLNGPVNVGDKITASPVSGLGMKATYASEIVGVAQTNLSSVKTVTKSFVGISGGNITAKVGLLPIAVNVAYYSAAPTGGSVSAFVPPFLQNLANSIAGKEVSPLRVLIGAITLVLGFATVVTMLYTGIRSGVISLGRNPLAADALRKGLIDILITAVGVLMVAGVIVAAVIAA